MQYVKTSDDVKIAYLSVGEGPPVVFASNIFGDAHNYHRGWPSVRDVTDRLVRLGWRVVRYDHRGMGFSDRNVEDVGLEARVRDLTAVVGQLGLTRMALAGVDLGAATAIAWAVQHPAAVSHLVLLSPWASGARRFALPAPSRGAGRGGHGRSGMAGLRTGDRQRRDRVRRWGPRSGGRRQYSAQYFTGRSRRVQPGIGGHRSHAAAAAGHMRTLVLHEPGFPFGSFDLCQDVAAGIRDAQLVIVDEKSLAGRVHDGHVRAIDQFLRVRHRDGIDATRSRRTTAWATGRARPAHGSRNPGPATGGGRIDQQADRRRVGRRRLDGGATPGQPLYEDRRAGPCRRRRLRAAPRPRRVTHVGARPSTRFPSGRSAGFQGCQTEPHPLVCT